MKIGKVFALIYFVQSNEVLSRETRDLISLNRYLNNRHLVQHRANSYSDFGSDLAVQTIIALNKDGKSAMVQMILKKLGKKPKKQDDNTKKRNNNRLKRFRMHHRRN